MASTNHAVDSMKGSSSFANGNDQNRFAALKALGWSLLLYAIFCVGLPIVPVPVGRVPPGIRLLMLVLPTMAFMYLQIRLSLSIVRLRPGTLVSLGLAVMALGLEYLLILHVHPMLRFSYSVNLGLYLFGSVFTGVLLTAAYTFAGSALSAIIRDKNTLLPVALVGMSIDYLGAMTPVGFTKTIITAHPAMVQAVSVPVPKVRGLGAAGLSPIAIIGPGDALFMALYFAAIIRLSLNERGTFQWMYWLLTAALLTVILSPNFDIAALVPMGAAVIIANRSLFTLSRAELFASLYAGLIVVGLAAAFFIYSHARLIGGH